MRALFAGTFDPFTLGHYDIVKKAKKLFSDLTVLVIDNPAKKPWLAAPVRCKQISDLLSQEHIPVEMLSAGLLVDYAKTHQAQVLVRGLRHASDFDYEWPLAQMNASLAPDIETCFLLPQVQHMHISSTLVRQVIAAGGSLAAFLPLEIAAIYQNPKSY